MSAAQENAGTKVSASAVVNTELWRLANAAIAGAGMTLDDVLARVIDEIGRGRKLPDDLLYPNDLTMSAIDEARR